MGKINLGKKLTAILCVVLCCVQTTGCDKKAVKEQADRAGSKGRGGGKSGRVSGELHGE